MGPVLVAVVEGLLWFAVAMAVVAVCVAAVMGRLKEESVGYCDGGPGDPGVERVGDEKYACTGCGVCRPR